jgi:hypothetical protein
MAIRFATASGLALAAALVFAGPARAQGFFSVYEMTPRQIVGMLADDGYELRGPMLRRGDVYVADVTSVSGRSVRLIVSARDGRIVERFATTPRWRHDDDEDVSRVARAPRYDDDSEPADRGSSSQMALGDLFNPPSRVYGNDSLFAPKPTPPAAIPDDSSPKPKHHVARKHKDSNVAKAPASDAPKPADAGSSVAAVAPNPAPEPKKPAVDPVKPAPTEAAKPAEPAPKPEPAQAKADEKRATAEPAPAPVRRVDAPPRKKLNDLPVGTLD